MYQFCLSEFLFPPSDFFLTLCCRSLHLQMNPLHFIHRMTTPQTKRSWPPPPVISGQPCKTWMQIWSLTNKTSLTHLILHPLLMRTVFLFSPQVRQNVAVWFLFPSLYLQPPVPKQCLQRSKHTRQTTLKGNWKHMFGWTVVYTNQQLFSLLIFCGTKMSLLAQFSTTLWPPEELPLPRGSLAQPIWVRDETKQTTLLQTLISSVQS